RQEAQLGDGAGRGRGDRQGLPRDGLSVVLLDRPRRKAPDGRGAFRRPFQGREAVAGGEGGRKERSMNVIAARIMVSIVKAIAHPWPPCSATSGSKRRLD